MSSLRPGVPGATRECPHCRTQILESAAVCPACRHPLRFEAGVASSDAEVFVPLRVEGSIQHPGDASPWEYSVVVSIRDERGVETARKVVGVGALAGGQQRSFSLVVEAAPVTGRSGVSGRRN